MNLMAEETDTLVTVQLRIQRTTEPGVIMAIAWEGRYLGPTQSWATKFIPWLDLREYLAEIINIPHKILDQAEKHFTTGQIFDMPMTAFVYQLYDMGFQRQTM